jgi:hypothetical protein
MAVPPEVGAHLPAEGVVLLAHVELRLRDVALGLGELEFRLVDVEPRDGSKLKLALRTFQRLVGEAERALLDAQVLAQLDSAPVSEFRRLKQPEQRVAQIVIALSNAASRQHQWDVIHVRAPVTNQGLHKAHRQTAVIHGVERGERAIGGALGFGESDVILRAVFESLRVREVERLGQ